MNPPHTPPTSHTESDRHTPKIAAAVLAAVTAVSVASTGSAGAAVPTRIDAFGGNAFGTTAHLGTVVNSGRTAFVPLCTTAAGHHNNNHIAATRFRSLGTVGAVTTSVASTRPAGMPTSTARSTTARSSLLGGLVSFNAVRVSASMSRRGSGYAHHAATSITALRIAGRAVGASVPVDRRIDIPGIATVQLNHQVAWTRGGLHAVAVVGMKIVITGNNPLHLPGGAVYIGRAQASLHDPSHALATGNAYGTRVTIASRLGSGQTAAVYLPCGGTSAALRNTTGALTLPSVVHVGAISSFGASHDNARHTSTTATTSNMVSGVNIAAGKITARAVTARAVTARIGNRVTRSDTGTRIVGLRVNGRTYHGSTRRNTHITVAGLGTLWLHRVVVSPTGLTVYGVQLVLGRALGRYPRGAVVTVAAATAGVRRR